MRPDISNRSDIAALVDTFYEKVKQNPVIAHFFTEVIPVNWEKHLPVMYDFWEGIVFGKGAYSGNPIQAHKKVHGLHQFQKSDFDEWLRLFRATVDEMFAGDNAELIKQRATSIATVMQMKVMYNSPFPG